MIQYAIITLTVLALLLLWRFGAWEERIVAVAVAVLMILAPLTASLQIAGIRPGVAFIELLFLTGILLLAYRCDRWWLLALAGFQTISLITHVVPLIGPDHYIWTAVTVRLEVWLLICATFFGGAWEAWAARRFAREGAPDDTTLPASRRPME